MSTGNSTLRVPPHLVAHVQRVTLVAGQQCTIQGAGIVRVMLIDGVIEIAGALIHAKCEYTFNLQPTQQRNLVLYSLEGGTVGIFCERPPHTLDVVKNTTNISSITNVVRETFQKGKRCVVAVAGGPQSGKTFAACTAANSLVSLCKRQESSVGNSAGAFLADATGCGPVPASVVCTELQQAGSSSSTGGGQFQAPPLWPGLVASPIRWQATSFWLGLQHAEISSNHMAWYLHVLKQLEATVESVAGREPDTQKSHVVYDLSAPDESIPKELFYKHVLQCIRPSIVILLRSGQTEGSEIDATWTETLREDIRRTSPSVQVVITDLQLKCASSSLVPGAALTRSLTDYFGGTLEHPLRAGKVVAPLSSLKWFRVTSAAASAASSSSWAAEALSSTASITSGTLCGVSLARLDIEIPYADIAGVVVVLRIDKEADEVVLFSPSGESLPNHILVLPPAPSTDDCDALWHLLPSQVAALESIEE